MTAASSPRERRLALIAWIAVCLIWGTTYLGIRVTLESMPPWLMGGLRWTVAGGLLALYMRTRGERLPPRNEWGGILLLGFLMLVLGNGGVVWAELFVPSGLTAVIVAASPFWMAGVEAMRSDGERLRARVVVGLLVGFSGILVLIWPELRAGNAGSSRACSRCSSPAWDGRSARPTRGATRGRRTCSAPPPRRCWPAA
jgi:drug/metabolite transporter (DMT)-like permease